MPHRDAATNRSMTLRPLAPVLLLALAGCAGAGARARGEPAPATESARGRFEVVGRGPVTGSFSTDLWVFQGVDGRDYAYTGTWGNCGSCFGDRLYVWDVTDPTRPALTDSVLVDARVVNDVKVNRAGTLAVITREGASDRRNGIAVLDLADPAHPFIRSVFTETLSGGVHNTFIEGDHVYAVHDGTNDVHVIDLSDPAAPREVGRWGIRQNFGKYLHDVWVDDGLAYLSYWDDGLVVLDVGKGIRGGTPQKPALVSRIRYRTRVGAHQYGNTHVAFPYTNRAGRRYVFVGDEIFPPEMDVTRQNVSPAGYIHVIDLADPAKPVETARYRVPNAGTHNVWVLDDVLYVAYYNGGLRAVDVSGELTGDLRAQGREIAALATGDANAFLRDRPFTWGAMPHEGLIFASDFNSGLWVTRLHRPEAGAN